MIKRLVNALLGQVGCSIHRKDAVNDLINSVEVLRAGWNKRNQLLKEEAERLLKNNIELQAQVYGRKSESNNTKLILIACMPKSGSTFLSKLVSEMTGFPIYPFYVNGITQALDMPEISKLLYVNDPSQELDLIAGSEIDDKYDGIISHQHLTCSTYDAKIINDFDVFVIVMERNLLDVVVSVRDHMLSREWVDQMESNDGWIDNMFLFCDTSFKNLSEADQYDYVIKLAVPWYLKFHMSWKKYQSRLKSPPLRLDYESVFSDLSGSMEKIKKHCGLQIQPEAFADAISGVKETRYNVGQSGRGLKFLSKQQIEEIEKQIRLYPEIADELIQWNAV